MLLERTVLPAGAAALLQCAWRAHGSRVQRGVGELALQRRAAVCIQRTWRAGEHMTVSLDNFLADMCLGVGGESGVVVLQRARGEFRESEFHLSQASGF